MTTEEPAAISLSARSASQWKTILLCERPSNEQPQSRLHAGPRSFSRHGAERADTGSEGGKPFRPVVFQSPVGLSTAPTRSLQRQPLPLPALVQHRRWLADRNRELQQQRKDESEPKVDLLVRFSSRLRTRIREGKGDLDFWQAARNARALKARQDALPKGGKHVVDDAASTVADLDEGDLNARTKDAGARLRAQSACSFCQGSPEVKAEHAVQLEDETGNAAPGRWTEAAKARGEGRGAIPKRPFRRRPGIVKSDSQHGARTEAGEKSAPGLSNRKGERPWSGADWKRRPKWALTEKNVDALEAEEADRLLDFVLGLDFASYCEEADDDLQASIAQVVLDNLGGIPADGTRRELESDNEAPPAATRSVPDGRWDSPSLLSSGEDDTWTLAAAIRRQERPVLAVHSTASIRTLIDQARPCTAAA